MTSSHSRESVPVERVPTASSPPLGPKSPVLVTGMHRSGTSWLGSMLCAGGDLINIGEPLNVLNRQTIFPKRVELWYAQHHNFRCSLFFDR